MGISKSEIFNDRQNLIARYAKALAHPARVAIIEHLLKTKGCICGDLVDVLPLAQSTVSQHLKELKDAGIIYGEIEGPRINYCINPKTWKDAMSLLGNIMDSLKDRECC